jgi:TnpA family transposase
VLRKDMQDVKDLVLDARNKRLKILGDDEIDALYGLPRFTYEERGQYFSLSLAEKTALDELHSTKSKTFFLLQLGYFKARQMFFVFSSSEVEEDVKYIQEQYFPDFQATELKVSNKTRLKQQRLILELFNYQNCDAAARLKLEVRARHAAKVCGKPVYIFREIMHELEEQRIVAPGYTFLQEAVGKALTFEQNRMVGILHHHLKPSDTDTLNGLLEDSSGLHEITYLKREPKDFTATEIKREIERGKQIRELYQLSKKVLLALKISNESIKYYASLVTYYSVYRLKRFDPWVVYVYLLCFVHHRYQRHYDNLLVSLIFYVRKFADAAKAAAKERVYEHRVETNWNLQKAAQVLKLFTDEKIAKDAPFHEVQAKAFHILDREKMVHVAAHITAQASFDETAFQWDHIDELGHQFKRYLRPILSSVNLKGSPAQTPLIEAIAFLKTAFGKGRPIGTYPAKKVPVRFIPPKLNRYLYTKDTLGNRRLVPDRYEFLVCRLLRERLEAGDIFCRDSVRFRSFKDDLIDDHRWRKKDKLFDSTGLLIFKLPIEEHLASLEQELEEKIAKVNQRIAAGENEYIKIKKQGNNVRWSLKYPGGKEDTNHPFFDALKQANIGSVLDFVNRHCQFMDAFDHVLGRYVKQEADDRIITACLLALGTNMGLGKMGQISDVSYNVLATTSDNFIRLETLKEANDHVSNAIAKMPIFRHYDIGDVVHSSSDGQKFETGIHTINARHSPKYFGLKKGVVSYTLVANHIPVNARIIGANEHESHYVLDILFNNTSEVQPEVHSTDTHGTNEVNFAILHLFGYQFAPRYKDIFGRVTTSLYGFKHPRRYQSGLLKPVRKISKKLIIEEWENIQRIIVSLALKTTTQSIIVGKLSAYARKNKARRALWEYDNIIKSLYMIKYIDSPPLRRNVQWALNRGESYHQLRRSVAYANFGKLRFKTEYEQQIWGECSHLITNCIICYNATILSSLLAYRNSTGVIEDAAQLKHISPVAWQHINLYGRYEFSKRPEAINMKEIIQELSQAPSGPH